MTELKPNFYKWSPQEFKLELLGNTHTLSFCLLVTSFKKKKSLAANESRRKE